MLSRLGWLLLLVRASHSFKFFTTYRPIECGETFSTKGGIELPAKVACEVKIQVPPGASFTFSLVNAESAYESCKKIIVVDDLSNQAYGMCTASLSFTGSGRSYSIRMKGLIEPVKAGISFSQAAFKCGQTVPRQRSETPFTLVNDGADPDGCFLIIPTSEILHITANTIANTGEACPVAIEISQGRHVAKMLKSTGSLCLGRAPVGVTIHCGMAILFLDAPLGTSVNISITRNTSPNRYTDSILQCNEFD